jgi:hypothetical protein
LPPNARYLLIQPDKERQTMESEQWTPFHARPILKLTDYRKRTVILAKVGENP